MKQDKKTSSRPEIVFPSEATRTNLNPPAEFSPDKKTNLIKFPSTDELHLVGPEELPQNDLLTSLPETWIAELRAKENQPLQLTGQLANELAKCRAANEKEKNGAQPSLTTFEWNPRVIGIAIAVGIMVGVGGWIMIELVPFIAALPFK